MLTTRRHALTALLVLGATGSAPAWAEQSAARRHAYELFLADPTESCED